MSIDLDAIKVRAAAATEGPWRVEALAHRVDIDSAMGAWLFRRCVDVECSVDLPWDEFVEAARNAVFIAHARTDVPALVAEVERLQRDNAQLLRDLDNQIVGDLAARRTLCAQSDEYRRRLDALSSPVSLSEPSGGSV